MTARWLMATSLTTSITISASVRNPNIAALATAAGWDGTGQIVVTINSGVDVASLSISGIPNDVLHIINNGRIGGSVNGGTGLYTRARLTLTNNGTIFGGGGRGGDGQAITLVQRGVTFSSIAGPGGNGAGFAPGGTTLTAAVNGSLGAGNEYTGPVSGGETPGWCTGGTGGNGGSIGVSGTAGESGLSGGDASFVSSTGPFAGNPAGYYVDGNSYVTWLATGTRLGRVI